MAYRLLFALLTILALTRPSFALEVEEGVCERMLSGGARVRIHYTSGLKAEVEPADAANVTSQVDVFPDGKRVAHQWIGGGGLLPLQGPSGRFSYADPGATRLRLEPGERRQLAFTYTSPRGRTASGTIALTVEEVRTAAFGPCRATFVTVVTATTFTAGMISSSRIVRLYVKELGFFIASTIEVMRNGKREQATFRATRVELMR
jgi:hypothetical protein